VGAAAGSGVGNVGLALVVTTASGTKVVAGALLDRVTGEDAVGEADVASSQRRIDGFSRGHDGSRDS